MKKSVKWFEGQRVHVNKDDSQWGRIASNGTVVVVNKTSLLVDVDSCRANVIVQKKDCFPFNNVQTMRDYFTNAIAKFNPTPNERGGFNIQTKVGTLWIEVQNGSQCPWIAARFEDVEAAKKHFGVVDGDFNSRLNPYSGKWNWMSTTKGSLIISFTGMVNELVYEIQKLIV